MILLTRLNHEPLVINAELILFVERTPDTMVTMINGNRVHVRESVDEVIERTLDYHARVVHRDPKQLAAPPSAAAAASDDAS